MTYVFLLRIDLLEAASVDEKLPEKRCHEVVTLLNAVLPLKNAGFFRK